MDKKYLDKHAQVIYEYDDQDPLYNMYSGTVTTYYLDGDVYCHEYHKNWLVYTGETRTYYYGTFDGYLERLSDGISFITNTSQHWNLPKHLNRRLHHHADTA